MVTGERENTARSGRRNAQSRGASGRDRRQQALAVYCWAPPKEAVRTCHAVQRFGFACADFSDNHRHPTPRRVGHGLFRRGLMVKLTVRERESIQEAVRRFRKLVERSGIKKEMRRREFFEKPSETKRRARLRAERRLRRTRLLGV